MPEDDRISKEHLELNVIGETSVTIVDKSNNGTWISSPFDVKKDLLHVVDVKQQSAFIHQPAMGKRKDSSKTSKAGLCYVFIKITSAYNE